MHIKLMVPNVWVADVLADVGLILLTIGADK